MGNSQQCGRLFLGAFFKEEQVQELLLASRQFLQGLEQELVLQDFFLKVAGGREAVPEGDCFAVILRGCAGQEFALPAAAFAFEEGAQITVDFGFGVTGKGYAEGGVVAAHGFEKAQASLAQGFFGNAAQMGLMGCFLEHAFIVLEKLGQGFWVALCGGLYGNSCGFGCQFSHL